MTQLDPLHFGVFRLHMHAGDMRLETATGFLIGAQRDGQFVPIVVTNWHVLAGRNPMIPGIVRHKGGGLPDQIRFSLHLLDPTPGTLMLQEICVPLFDDHGKALWSEHPTRGRRCDVGVIEIRGPLTEKFHFETVNGIASSNDMAIGLGSEVFIVGYPLGFSHFALTPIWKRGSIASEPHISDEKTDGRVVIDATTREGMSGSPVLMRAATHYLTEDGEVRQAPGAMRFLGVYSSRPAFEEEGGSGPPGAEVTAEIGFFVKSGLVTETITSMKAAADRDSVPD